MADSAKELQELKPPWHDPNRSLLPRAWRPRMPSGSLTSLIAVADGHAAALGYGTVELKDELELSDLIVPLGADDANAVLKKVEALPGRITEALGVISSHR